MRLYSQFGSKDRLVEERWDMRLPPAARLGRQLPRSDRYISSYLAPEHRDRGQGCRSPPGVRDAASRHGVRDRFTAGLRGMIRQIGGRVDPGLKQRQRDDKALATVAS